MQQYCNSQHVCLAAKLTSNKKLFYIKISGDSKFNHHSGVLLTQILFKKNAQLRKKIPAAPNKSGHRYYSDARLGMNNSLAD
jgi:hypothetical protein